MSASENDGAEKPLSPPYIAYQSLKTTAKYMKEHGLTNRIDRSVLTNFSGSVAGQVLTGLKFLKLIDVDGTPTPRMRELTDAYDTEQWGAVLAEVLREAYAPLFELNLETATPSEFNERFRKEYPGTDDVVRKCITFFLNATRETDIKVSPFIMKNKKPRSSTTRRRGKVGSKAEKGNEADGTNGSGDDQSRQPQVQMTRSQQLLEMFDPNEMGEAEQEALWTLLKYFRGKGE